MILEKNGVFCCKEGKSYIKVGDKVNRKNRYHEEQQKTMFFTGLGCFLWIVIFVVFISFYPAKFIYHLFVPAEKLLLVSHSPNEINSIKIVKRDDFPDPTIRILYQDKNVMKTKIPDELSVQWENDDSATVIFIKEGRDADIVEIDFKL